MNEKPVIMCPHTQQPCYAERCGIWDKHRNRCGYLTLAYGVTR